jgi:serine/threonine protein kinase
MLARPDHLQAFLGHVAAYSGHAEEYGAIVATRRPIMAKSNSRGQLVVHSNRTLHRYVINDRIGAGGYGEVFRARVVDLNLLVALKRFKMRSGFTQQALADWSSEYTTHEALSHPNILQAYDAFEDDGFLYIATELATKSVNQYIDTYSSLIPPWDDIRVAKAGMHLASALHYLHTGWRDGQPLLHRDVTPSNVFVFEETNTFKLGDFGISKHLDEPDGVAVTQVANWGFVSPELLRLGFTVPQSDLFQLGLVLYTMAAGAYVVPKSASPKEKKEAIASGQAYKSAAMLTDIDDDLRECIKLLLLRNLEKRIPVAEVAHSKLSKIYYRLRSEAAQR